MTQKQAIERWRESAEENFLLMQEMMQLKHYDWALFMGQLGLEKLLKGLVTQVIDDAPPYTHDLVKLAELARLSLSDKQKMQLSQITKFHV